MRCLAVAHNVKDLVRPRAHGGLWAHHQHSAGAGKHPKQKNQFVKMLFL
jgi:hypothetical protein